MTTRETPAVKVSVVIPAYNAARFIRRTIDSVLAQRFESLEVLVVDDGSADRTAEIVAAMPSPVMLVSGPRQGVSAARNEAVRLSRGEYIAFMDHDDLWEEGKLRGQARLLDADPGVGLVFTQARMVADGDTSEVFPVIEDPGEFLKKAYENLAHWNYIPMSSVMVRKTALDHIVGGGRFDGKFELAEDWDLWLRMAARHRLAFINEPLTRYMIVPGRATERMADLRLEDIAIFGRELSAHPELMAADPRRCEATLYRLHEEAGYWLMKEGRGQEARRALREAWRLRPASLKPLGYIVASLVAPAMVRASAAGGRA